MLPVIIEYAGPATTAGRIRHERCKVSKIGAFAFYKSAVKTVVLPDSIKEIEGFAFDSSNMQSLVLPEGASLGSYSLPRDMKYVSFPQSLSGGAFSGPYSLWGNSVKMYDSDGITQIKDNELDKIKGQRFVWDGSTARKLFRISESQVLLTANVGDETSYRAVPKGSVYAPEPPAVPEHSTFGGWFTDPGFSERYDAAVPLDADTAVYALFSPETHTVTYEVDGKVVGDVETYEYGEEVAVRAAYIKTGYTVGAWASESVVPVEGRFTIGEPASPSRRITTPCTWSLRRHLPIRRHLPKTMTRTPCFSVWRSQVLWSRCSSDSISTAGGSNSKRGGGPLPICLGSRTETFRVVRNHSAGGIRTSRKYFTAIALVFVLVSTGFMLSDVPGTLFRKSVACNVFP